MPRDIGIWLTIGSMAATGFARFVAVEEKLTNNVEVDGAQNTQLGRLDDRQRKMETDNSLLAQIIFLNGKVEALSEQVRNLRAELSNRRR